MAEASSEIQQVLRQSMADLVAHMAERLDSVDLYQAVGGQGVCRQL
jgi:hypothetical protein